MGLWWITVWKCWLGVTKSDQVLLSVPQEQPGCHLNVTWFDVVLLCVPQGQPRCLHGSWLAGDCWRQCPWYLHHAEHQQDGLSWSVHVCKCGGWGVMVVTFCVCVISLMIHVIRISGLCMLQYTIYTHMTKCQKVCKESGQKGLKKK